MSDVLLCWAVVAQVLAVLFGYTDFTANDFGVIFVIDAALLRAVVPFKALDSLNLEVVTHFTHVPLVLHQFLTDLRFITKFVPGLLVTGEDQTTKVIWINVRVTALMAVDHFYEFHVVLSGTLIVPKTDHGTIGTVMDVFDDE
jgi:hypothetical protein